MAQLNFDATNVPQAGLPDPLPAGDYTMQVVDSELKPTKAPGGMLLKLTLQVIDGQHAGRKVFDNINLQNANPVAVEIGQQQLSSYCHATGCIQLGDSQQLHGIPIRVKVTIRKSEQYGDSNEVKRVERLQQAAAPGMQPMPTMQPQPQPDPHAEIPFPATPAPAPAPAPAAPPPAPAAAAAPAPAPAQGGSMPPPWAQPQQNG